MRERNYVKEILFPLLDISAPSEPSLKCIPDSATIMYLEEILKQAICGEITGLLALVHRGEDSVLTYSGDVYDDLENAMNEIEVIKNRLS